VGFIVVYFAYYLTFEFLFGQTFGKLITGTEVLDEEGNRPVFRVVLKRTLSRFIPYDAHSFASEEIGLHDKLSKTIVIDKRKSQSFLH